MNRAQSCCILGIGNARLSDEGIGAYICQRIDTMRWPGVETLVRPRLSSELVDILLSFDCTIVIFASVSMPEIDFHSFVPENEDSAIPEQHKNLESLYRLAEQASGKAPVVQVCAVRGEEFETGETLSAACRRRADKALEAIHKFVLLLMA